nr:nonaspanin [Tanacetum cinerariifolium]
MDLFAFIHVPDPTKVRVVEWEWNNDEPPLLETTIGHTVLLLSVSPDRLDRELEASVNRLFDEGGSVHQEDHGTLSRIFIGSKSRSSLQKLLVGAVLNAEVGVTAIPTLPFVTAFVSTMPERKDEAHMDFMAEPNLRSIGASQWFVISSDSPYHSGTHVAEVEVDSFVRSSVPVMTIVTTVTSVVDLTAAAKEKPFEPSLFGVGSSSAGGADPTPCGFSDLNGSDFLISGIRTVIDPDTREEEIGSLKARLLLKEVKAAEAIRLRAKASNFKAAEKSLWDEADALRERNIILEKERDALDVKVTELETLAMKTFAFGLQEKVAMYGNCMGQLEKFQDDRMNIVEDKAVIGKAIEKGMQDGLSARISHGKEGRVLTDVAAYNPSAKGDYISALQQLQNVNFSLLAELKSNKDSSVENIMNILRLKEALAERLGLNVLQPHVDQLMVPIHHSPDKTVVGATALSFSMDVSSVSV